MPTAPNTAGALVGQRLGSCELLALIALGGTAEIYLARMGGAAGFAKYVVVKCLHDHLAEDHEFVQMFLDEARLGAQLDHSNIVQTLELGQHEGRYFLVMEYLAGMSLALIARKAAERLPGGRLPTDVVLGMAAQACTGLHYAHERNAEGAPLNIVHRDVSPQNLVVSFEGILKVVDFGIAKAARRATRTRSGTIKGKFAYMSPEQCLAAPLDRRTDIFALGIVVHELVTGQRLFKRDATYDTYHAIIDGDVRPPTAVCPDLDPALDPLIMKALAYDRDARYPTAEAFGEALHAALHRRGSSMSASELARFFESHFASELDEHNTRMRELIEGRPSTLDDLQWDTSDPDSDARRPVHELRAATDRLSATTPGLQAAEDHPQDPSGQNDDATRIEQNPLGRSQDACSGASAGDEDATTLSPARHSEQRPAAQPPPIPPPRQPASDPGAEDLPTRPVRITAEQEPATIEPAPADPAAAPVPQTTSDSPAHFATAQVPQTLETFHPSAVAHALPAPHSSPRSRHHQVTQPVARQRPKLALGVAFAAALLLGVLVTFLLATLLG